MVKMTSVVAILTPNYLLFVIIHLNLFLTFRLFLGFYNRVDDFYKLLTNGTFRSNSTTTRTH